MPQRWIRKSLLIMVAMLGLLVACDVIPNRSLTTHLFRPTVSILIDNTQIHQQIEGFGATHTPLVYEGVGDVLHQDVRQTAIAAAFKQVGLTMGNVEGALLESPAGWNARANDDDDPFHFNWKGFQTKMADATYQKIIQPAKPLGFDHYYLSQKVNVRWASPWLASLRHHNYDRFLDEVAEQVVAGHLHWRKAYGIVPHYQMLFNEPLSGNHELQGTVQEVVDIVKRVGARLQREGFQAKFVLPNEETEENTLKVAQAILADPQARQYVGAIGYHPYPYGSAYSSIDQILKTSGAGKPLSDRIAIRHQLRDLGQQYKIPVWMTEVSHGGVDARSFAGFRGRAIHIHDELVYANAAAYFGMNSLWDSTSQQMHFGNQHLFSEEGNVVLIDNAKEKVHLTGMGYAIGHYARWVKPGAIRIEATSQDPFVQVTAFRDDRQKRFIVVAINNASEPKTLKMNVKGLELGDSIMGEQSTKEAYWRSLSPMHPESRDQLLLEIPAQSVTTLVSQLNLA